MNLRSSYCIQHCERKRNRNVLAVENVRKTYDVKVGLVQKRRLTALQDVSFQVKNGETVAIVGESGSGKSTLARIIVGLEEPNEGSVHFKKENVMNLAKMSMKAYRKDCQLIFQDPLSSLNPSLTIRKILQEPLENHLWITRKTQEDMIIEWLKKVELRETCLNEFPHQLSGGERQRVNLVRALLLEPELLVCDEIISNLDVMVQESILSLLKKLNNELGMSLLFISHDLVSAQSLCDRMIVMQKGKIVDDLLSSSFELHQCHPYTKQLFEAIPIDHPSKRGAIFQ